MTVKLFIFALKIKVVNMDNPDDKVDSEYISPISNFLDKIQSAIYLLVAIFLAIMALITFFIVGKDLTQLVYGTFELTVIVNALRDLLVTLIIAELIQTVKVYLESHQLDIKLILSVGLTAMLRSVLVFGVEKIAWEEMAVTALILLILIIGIVMVGDNKIPQTILIKREKK